MKGSDQCSALLCGELERGRDCYERGIWGEAWRLLSIADQACPLSGADLELLAMSAFLIGREEDYLALLSRAHRVHAEDGERLRAVRCAFQLGWRLLLRSDEGGAAGWFARARRLLERGEGDCVEQGYLLLPRVQQHVAARDWDAAYLTAEQAAEIGERFAEADLTASARYLQGCIRLQQEKIQPGLALLDEVMLVVASGELSPVVTGSLYCGAIEGSRKVYALDRSREWLAAFICWCKERPGMVAFTDACIAHRAEILRVSGELSDAIAVPRIGQPDTQAFTRQAVAAEFYYRAEIHRFRGEFAAADEAYRRASEAGRDPQPGLALLRTAQGRIDVAGAAIRRSLIAVTDRLERVRYLPAYIEILLAAGETQEARQASIELETTAQSHGTETLKAIAASSRGAVELAEGDAHTALRSLRYAWHVWQKFGAPYLMARVRVLVALACDALGDSDGYELELAAARTVFEALGATSDVARIDSLSHRAPDKCGGLTARELQVLRLVAEGKTNKAIAAQLFLSEKTVDRHVSNIFVKLDVPSRAAATAFAYEHRLIDTQMGSGRVVIEPKQGGDARRRRPVVVTDQNTRLKVTISPPSNDAAISSPSICNVRIGSCEMPQSPLVSSSISCTLNANVSEFQV